MQSGVLATPHPKMTCDSRRESGGIQNSEKSTSRLLIVSSSRTGLLLHNLTQNPKPEMKSVVHTSRQSQSQPKDSSLSKNDYKRCRDGYSSLHAPNLSSQEEELRAHHPETLVAEAPCNLTYPSCGGTSCTNLSKTYTLSPETLTACFQAE